MKHVGVVTLMGRPNVGKSTLLNNLLGKKVSITSPKPQTTRFPLEAVYEDDRCQIIFTDTPGVFNRAPDPLSKSINLRTEHALQKPTDLVVYMIDPTRPRDQEENKSLGLVRKIDAPKILVVNKLDAKQRYLADYSFYEDEFDEKINISALKKTNLNLLLDLILKYLPQKEELMDTSSLPYPTLNLDSKMFVSEIIREKVFLLTHDELPYTVQTQVDSIDERKNGTLYIRAQITTTSDKYKKMLIGRSGLKIKELGIVIRKELETATAKKVYLDLEVSVNPHWQSQY